MPTIILLHLMSNNYNMGKNFQVIFNTSKAIVSLSIFNTPKAIVLSLSIFNTPTTIVNFS